MAQIDKQNYYLIYDKATDTLYGDEIVFYQTEENYSILPNDLNIENSGLRPSTEETKTSQFIFNGSDFDVGKYSAELTFENENDSTDKINFNVSISVFNNYSPPPVFIPSVPKYFLEFGNIENDIYRLEIWEKDYDGVSTEIRGSVSHKYTDRKDLTEAIVSSNLEIELEADQDLNLQDLYTEDEGSFTVKYFRNSELIFIGILKPDGIIEDFVYDKWEISLDAMDGLNILKDLSFVKDDETFYSGKISQFEAIKQCLHRIGYDLPINISILLRYNGFNAGTGSILQYTYVNANRFYQDKETDKIMSCENVLKSILELYNATIIQQDGEWWIFRAIDLQENTTFIRYVGSLMTGGEPLATDVNLGSHIDGFEIHHINSNQRKSINPSVQAFRANYKYGTVKSISRNPNIELQYGLDSDGWIINPGDVRIKRQYDGTGFDVVGEVTTDLELIRTNQLISVTVGDALNVIFNFENEIFFGQTIVKYIFTTDNYIFNSQQWVSKASFPNAFTLNFYGSDITNITQTYFLPPMPETGFLNVKVVLMQNYNIYGISTPIFSVNSISIVPNKENNYKGEYHTAQRATRISSVTKTDKTVSNGDSVSDIYLGTTYDSNMNPTTGWIKTLDLLATPVDLLKIMAVDTLRIAPRPMIQFEGDIYGYMPYLSLININNVSGKYQFEKYSFDAKTNINKVSLREFDNVNLVEGVDYNYEKTIDYGKEVKVLINP